MKLQKPFKDYFRISQRFGQNLNGFYQADELKGHTGIDFACPIGTPILAPCNGTVVYVSRNAKKGEAVTIISSDTFKWNDQDCRLSILFAHLKDGDIKVNVEDEVKTGDFLALSGNTGQTTGPHLHLHVVPISPAGTYKELTNYNNGYRGCIDPLPYLDLDTPQIKHICLLQTLLNENGNNLLLDGKFGKITLSALNKFLGTKLK